ncbi:MAG TPA: hypothetical protein VLX91_12605 [Candidatus Acidoferrales bacterium]|nr:hypothetical protein [Candidatus Acidoferrales bacterium]
MRNEKDVVSAFDEIIEGKFVSRRVVDLRGDDLNHEGEDFVRPFIRRLKLHGFVEKPINEIELQFEERVPAFVIRNCNAYFGWVFIERFTQKKSRKMFGSVVRNKKGDWLIQVSHNSTEPVYANLKFKTEMESERLFVME